MSRWYSFHIKNEILFWFFLLALLPLLVLTSINYLYQKTIYEEQAKEHLQLILNQQLNSIDNYISLLNQEIEILASTPDIKKSIVYLDKEFKENGNRYNTDKKYDEEFFKNIVAKNHFYDMFFINTNGDIIYSVKKENDLGTNLLNGLYANSNLSKALKSSLDLLETQISDFEFYPPSNKDASFIATPVYNKGKIIGSLAIQINTNEIYNIFLSQEGLGNTGELFAAKIDKDNKTISTTPLLKNKDSVTLKYQFPTRKDLPINKAVNGNKGCGVAYDYKDDPIIAAWGYIPSLRWGVVAKMDLKEILLPISELRFYSIIVLFFVMLGIVVAILVAIKHIVEPIERLTNKVKNFANEKFETRSDEVELDNEIGDLARNFYDMSLSLKASQHTIQNYANELEEKVRVRTNELEIAKNNIEESNKNMKRYLKIIDDHVITSSTNRAGTITAVSSAFCKITGYTKEELIGKKHNIIRHPDMPASVYKDLWETISLGNTWTGEIKNQRKDGSFYWVKSTITPVFDLDNNIVEYTSIREDITDKKIVEKLSITDQLTQLYNRVKLEDVFKNQISRSLRYDEPFSIILLDIDHFKSVNDNFGHDIGDETLKDVAEILRENVRESDIVGRWGGEEFLIIAIETNLDNTVALAQKLREKVEAHNFKVIGKKTASFGVSTFNTEDSQESIIKRADEALYEAKKSGRNCVKIG